MTDSVWLVLPGVILWAVILALPWQPWRNRETLEADSCGGNADLSGVTVPVPARNEAGVIAETLGATAAQGRDLGIVLVDDRSENEFYCLLDSGSGPE